MNDLKTTYLIKNIFRDDNRLIGFTENHLLLLVYLQKFTTYSNKIYFIFNFMFTDLKIENSKKLIKTLYQCLFDLDNWGLINITNNVELAGVDKNTIIIIDRVEYEDNYTMVYASEIDSILSCNEDIRSKRTLLYIYVLIVSRIDDKGYCFPRIDTFKRDIETKSDNRINDAIKLLKEMGLIDFANVGVVKNGKRIYQANNIYVTTITNGYSEILSSALDDSRFYFENAEIEVLQNKSKEEKEEEVQDYFGQPNPMEKVNIGRTAKSFKEVELQNVETILRYYQNNVDNLTKEEKEKAKELVSEYRKLKLELGA